MKVKATRHASIGDIRGLIWYRTLENICENVETVFNLKLSENQPMFSCPINRDVRLNSISRKSRGLKSSTQQTQ